jgi:glycosyltransferase involved in cell wall biosynthesis
MLRLSVVMSVFNGATQLGATLDAIAAQTMRDYELVAIDDGSTDATAEILRQYAANDPRIRIISTTNQGLTQALIRGCAEAAAPVIAREDCGDVSAPERYTRQLDVLDRDPGTVLVSCAARHVGPNGEELTIERPDGNEVRRSLLHDDIGKLHGLAAHGTAMFRRADYLAAGGYRAEFRFAQDLDLWIRLARRGRIVVLPEALYTWTYAVSAISSTRRAQQVALARIALRLRDDAIGGEERAKLLADAARIGETPAKKSQPRDAAASHYFIASCLRRNRDPRWRDYARNAVRRDPLHLRSWLLLLKP